MSHGKQRGSFIYSLTSRLASCRNTATHFPMKHTAQTYLYGWSLVRNIKIQKGSLACIGITSWIRHPRLDPGVVSVQINVFKRGSGITQTLQTCHPGSSLKGESIGYWKAATSEKCNYYSASILYWHYEKLFNSFTINAHLVLVVLYDRLPRTYGTFLISGNYLPLILWFYWSFDSKCWQRKS